MHTAQREDWCWIGLWCDFLKSFIWWRTRSFLAKPHQCESEPRLPRPPRLHCTIHGCAGCRGATPASLSPSPPVLLFPRWQGPRAPLFSIPVGGRRALCLAAIVPDTRLYLTDTRAVRRERRRRRGHRWPLLRRRWQWKHETRWPSVVRVCNLQRLGVLCTHFSVSERIPLFCLATLFYGHDAYWGGFPLLWMGSCCALKWGVERERECPSQRSQYGWGQPNIVERKSLQECPVSPPLCVYCWAPVF